MSLQLDGRRVCYNKHALAEHLEKDPHDPGDGGGRQGRGRGRGRGREGLAVLMDQKNLTDRQVILAISSRIAFACSQPMPSPCNILIKQIKATTRMEIPFLKVDI
eukprot:764747-Hanusia_phi.AAC.3